MDTELWNSLWNALQLYYWGKIRFEYRTRDVLIKSNLYSLFSYYWQHYFKLLLDDLPKYYRDAKDAAEPFPGVKTHITSALNIYLIEKTLITEIL